METAIRNNTNVPEYILHWEEFDRLYYKGDYKQLILSQKEYIKQHPEDDRERLLLADAYMYDGQDKRALKILSNLHKKYPFDIEYMHTLSECLYKLKRDPNTYDWKRKVIIFDNNQKCSDFCYEYIKSNGSECSFTLLYEMEEGGYSKYDTEALELILSNDERFSSETMDDESIFSIKDLNPDTNNHCS